MQTKADSQTCSSTSASQRSIGARLLIFLVLVLPKEFSRLPFSISDAFCSLAHLVGVLFGSDTLNYSRAFLLNNPPLLYRHNSSRHALAKTEASPANICGYKYSLLAPGLRSFRAMTSATLEFMVSKGEIIWRKIL